MGSGDALLEGLEAAHPGQDREATRFDVVTAHLLAREPGSLEQDDARAVPRQTPGERAPGGAAADDDDVGSSLGHVQIADSERVCRTSSSNSFGSAA